MLVLLLALQADPVAELVERLTDDRVDVRADAEARLLELPVRLLPKVLEEAARRPEIEVRGVIERIRIGPAWPTLLPGTIREARALAQALADPAHPERPKVAARVMDRLAALPPGEAPKVLLKLLDEPSEALHHFALSGLRRFTPADPEPLLPYLKAARTSGLAAEILVAMKAESTVPLAVDLFCEEGGATLGAARILEAFGAGAQAARVAAAIRERIGLLVWGIRILRATGPRAEPLLLDLVSQVSAPRQKEIAEALAEIGSDVSLPVLRTLLADSPPSERDRLLAQARDPEWARDALEQARAQSERPPSLRALELAAVGGPRLRDAVLAWATAPGVPAGLRRDLLIPLLGACGRPEDAPLLLQALRDPRLAEAAAEALDMAGDPRHAREIFDAALRGRFLKGDPLLRGLAPEEVEDGLLEAFRDPRGYAVLSRAALVLAERRLSPRLRTALFDLLADRDAAGLRGEALRILAGRAGPDDLPRLAALRASQDATVRAAGLLLASRAGDPEAGRALCAHLAASTGVLSYEARLVPFLDLASTPGSDFEAAVRAEWVLRPVWSDGAVWLASRGDPAAAAAVRELVKGADAARLMSFLRALAEGGDRPSLERIRDRALAGYVPPDLERLVLLTADDAFRARLVAALPAGPALRLAAILDLPEIEPHLLAAAARGFDKYSIDAGFAALARRNPRGTSELLYRLLRSPSAGVRAAAATAVGEIGDRTSLRRLGRLIDDPGLLDTPPFGGPLRRVWHAAMEALEKLEAVAPERSSTASRRAFWRSRLEKLGDR
jgi:hypothetical protein